MVWIGLMGLDGLDGCDATMTMRCDAMECDGADVATQSHRNATR